jgi:hypothetical protein
MVTLKILSCHIDSILIRAEIDYRSAGLLGRIALLIREDALNEYYERKSNETM